MKNQIIEFMNSRVTTERTDALLLIVCFLLVMVVW